MLKRLLTILACLLFLSSIVHAWLAGYGFRKQFTVQGANLDSNQTHFPIVLILVDSDVDDECDDDGDRSFDIRFTQSDDSVLDVDWIDYSEAGGNATIICMFSDAGWTINANGTTTGYMYYGNAAAGDPATDAGVWDANFKGVWHLIEDGDGTPDEFADSSGTGNHGKGGAGEVPTQVNGEIYKAQDFDGTDDWIDAGTDPSLDIDQPTTITAVVERQASQHQTIWATNKTGDSGWGTNGYHFRVNTDNKLQILKAGVGSLGESTGTLNQDTSYHVAVTYDTDGSWVFYINGSSSGNGLSDNTFDHDIHSIGRKSTEEAEDFNGLIEELRIASSIRSADWIDFAYHNIYEGDNELTWGAEQAADGDGFIPKVIIIREEH